ncbi:MAG: hypothetical protein KKE46_06420 [Gammaproteobacteria bacterium]|nr:hypothetical protein [Gammaproteobacteria bacterium]
MKLNMIVRYEAIDGSDTSFSGIDIEPWSAQFESDAVIKKSEYFIGMNYTSKNISFCRIKGASGANFEIHVPIETEGRFILKILTMPGSHFQISSALFAVIQQGDNIRKTQENYNFNVKKSTSKDRNATMIIHKMVGDK